MAKLDDLPVEILRVIAKYAVSQDCCLGDSRQNPQSDLLLRLISKSFASCIAEAVVHKIHLADEIRVPSFFQGTVQTTRYVPKLAEFIETTKTGAHISTVQIDLSRNEPDPKVLSGIRTIMRMATNIRKLSIRTGLHQNYSGQVAPGDFLGPTQYTYLRELQICSKYSLQILQWLSDKGAQPEKLEISGQIQPTENSNPSFWATGFVDCVSVHTLTIPASLFSSFRLLRVSPVELGLSRTIYLRFVNAIDDVIGILSQDQYLQRLRTLMLLDYSAGINVNTRRFIALCREKALSLGTQVDENADIVWLCTAGKLTSAGEVVTKAA